MELLVKLALTGKLNHEEDALLVVEVTVQSEDVGVPGGLMVVRQLLGFMAMEGAHLRLDWISISRRTCFSTLDRTSSCLYMHLRATM